MGLILRGRIFHYEFIHKGKRYQGTTGKDNRLEAQLVEDDVKRNLGKENWVRQSTADPGIYFLQSPSTKLVKIGCSGNVSERIKDYATHSAEPLFLLAKVPAVDYRKAEREVQEFLGPFRERGEWYRITGRHIEAAIGYWMMGHKDFGDRKRVNGSVEEDSSVEAP